MGLLSALGRGAKSFGKHYANTAGAGMAYGALLGGGLNTYGDMQNGGEFNPENTLNGIVGGAVLGAIPGGAIGVMRGAEGAVRAAGLNPVTIARAVRILRSRGMSESQIRRLADDDIVKAAFHL